MSDVDSGSQFTGTHRQVTDRPGPAEAERTVLLRRTYDAAVEDVWDACTDPERIGRWFLPVTGDLRLGGKYQLKGNAGGEILRCKPPRLLRVTWVFGDGPPSEMELRLSTGDGAGTMFELAHSGVGDPALWSRFGPGAVGIGWDLAMLGLGMHLSSSGDRGDGEAWLASPDGREFVTSCSDAWGEAFRAYGATPAEAGAAVENCTAFYLPPDIPPGADGLA